jgi:hypothetical protein
MKLKIINELNNKDEEKSNTTIDLKEIHQIADLLGFKSTDEFVKKVFCLKDNETLGLENKLRILYFTIKAEIEKLDKIKNRIEARANFRIRVLLILLFALLTGQTIWFYHMIFNVEYLGWDIIEPTTFLLGSATFILGLFTYIKLNRSMLSSEHIVKTIRERFYMKMYAKENFNIERYMLLHNEADGVKDSIERLEKL